MKRETLAAIDIGSNAIRLLINYIEQDNSSIQFKKAAFIRVPIRLGEDVFTGGEIGSEKRIKLCQAMMAFSQLMSTFNVKGYRACATSAMREAKNGGEVVEFIRSQSGINIEVISGSEEAKTIFKSGGIDGLLERGKNYLYVDVGGGSTEITIYSDGKPVGAESFPIGTVRSISGAVKKSDLKQFKEWLEQNALPHNPIAIIGSGGNINKVNKLLQKRNGEAIVYDEIKELYDKLNSMSYDQRVEEMGLNIYRADVIIPALNIFTTVAQKCKINKIIVPKIGLADGIIKKLYYTKSNK